MDVYHYKGWQRRVWNGWPNLLGCLFWLHKERDLPLWHHNIRSLWRKPSTCQEMDWRKLCSRTKKFRWESSQFLWPLSKVSWSWFSVSKFKKKRSRKKIETDCSVASHDWFSPSSFTGRKDWVDLYLKEKEWEEEILFSLLLSPTRVSHRSQSVIQAVSDCLIPFSSWVQESFPSSPSAHLSFLEWHLLTLSFVERMLRRDGPCFCYFLHNEDCRMCVFPVSCHKKTRIIDPFGDDPVTFLFCTTLLFSSCKKKVCEDVSFLQTCVS